MYHVSISIQHPHPHTQCGVLCVLIDIYMYLNHVAHNRRKSSYTRNDH